MLKPMLARGELRLVGATTLDEYRSHIEKDAALERRFQPVLVEQPTVDAATAILRGLKERYEVHHGVRITSRARGGGSPVRPLRDGPILLDKAIDPIDEAAFASASRSIPCRSRSTRWTGASASWRSSAPRSRRRRILRRRSAWNASRRSWPTSRSDGMRAHWEQEKDCIDRIRALKSELEETRAASERAERDGDLEKAAELRFGSIVELERQLEEENARLQERSSRNRRC